MAGTGQKLGAHASWLLPPGPASAAGDTACCRWQFEPWLLQPPKVAGSQAAAASHLTRPRIMLRMLSTMLASLTTPPTAPASGGT